MSSELERIRGYEAACASDSDPLGEWVKYLGFCERRSTTAEGVSRLRLVRERCGAALARDARYADDERYVRVWLSLASESAAPELVFERLAALGIGSKLALFWVAWAFVAEKADRVAEADELYARGTEQRAEPRQMLAKRRREFERRMKRRWLSAEAEKSQHCAATDAVAARAASPSRATTGFAILDAAAPLPRCEERAEAADPARDAPVVIFDDAAETAAPTVADDAESARAPTELAPAAFAIFDDADAPCAREPAFAILDEDEPAASRRPAAPFAILADEPAFAVLADEPASERATLSSSAAPSRGLRARGASHNEPPCAAQAAKKQQPLLQPSTSQARGSSEYVADDSPPGSPSTNARDERSFEELRVAGDAPVDRKSAPLSAAAAGRAPLRVVFGERNRDPVFSAQAKPRRLVFSTAKRDRPAPVPTPRALQNAPAALSARLRRAAREEDLTINSAIAIREMDDLFAGDEEHASEREREAPGSAWRPGFDSDSDEDDARARSRARAGDGRADQLPGANEDMSAGFSIFVDESG